MHNKIKERYGALGLSTIAIALSALVFHFQGNASNIAMEPGSIFRWIIGQWTLSGSDFSHGWIMPLISLYVIYLKKNDLLKEEKSPSVTGLLLFAGTCLMHWIAYRGQQPRISLLAFTGMLLFIPWAICGWKTARHLLFPVGYLMLTFTSYFLISFTFKMRLVSTAMASGILNGIGIAAIRSGTAIRAVAEGGFVFNVADPCSGLRSLVVMLALAAPYAYFTQSSLTRKWILFSLSIPLAILGNSLRIVTIGIIATFFSSELAFKIWHDFSGFLLFGIEILLIVSAGAIININFKEILIKWKEKI